MKSLLKQLDYFPSELFNLSPGELYDFLGGPVLIHLKGRREEPLFVSTLLHGNEVTGFFGLQKLLSEYEHRPLDRSISIFFGNVEAAKTNCRFLPHQPDYNRIWKCKDSPEGQMMQEVIAIMKSKNIFASIDVHNNTGHNPYYACVSKENHLHYHLATLFRRTVVYFTKPSQTQSVTFSDFCPAVTIECGLSEDEWGVQAVSDYLKACLKLDHLPKHPIMPQDIDLYATYCRMVLKPGLFFCFEGDSEQEKAEVVFRRDLDKLNFSEIEAGTVLGKVKEKVSDPIVIQDPDGAPLKEEVFAYEEGKVIARKKITPSMLTLKKEVIAQDCFGYLMRPQAL